MTIASTTSKVSYNGSGSTGPFPITFKFTKNADIVATKRSSAGVETTLALTTDYTLTGAGDASGGALTLVVALAVGESLVIARVPGIVQEVDYVENSAFPAETHEGALDLLTMICQSLQEQIDRSVKVEISSTTSPDDLLAEIAAEVASGAASAAMAGASATAASASASAASSSASSAAASALEAAASAGIQPLTANRTYYVRTDGSDSNDGLTNTSAGAFSTIQKAVNVVAGLNLNGYAVTIKVGDGTYTAGASLVGPLMGSTNATPLSIQGNTTTPANCVVSVTGGNCFNAEDGGKFTLRGFKLSTTTSGCCINAKSGEITFGDIEFGSCASHHRQALDHGRVYSMANTGYTISGGAVSHIHCPNASYQVILSPVTITLTGTPAFSSYFVGVAFGYVQSFANVTFSGSATGQRFLVHNYGFIKTGGIYPTSATHFPGDVAGIANCGGYDDFITQQYINGPDGALNVTSVMPVKLTSTGTEVMALQSDSGTSLYTSYDLKDSGGTQVQCARVTGQIATATPGAVVGALKFGACLAGTMTDILFVGSGVGSGTGAAQIVRPLTDNVMAFGMAAARPKEIFAASATINTSDAREKTTVAPLTDAEVAAAKALAREVGTYRFLSAVTEKGDKARMHVGMTVQRAIEIMASHGLDPMSYSFICHDEWENLYQDVEVEPAVLDGNGDTVVPAVMESRLVTPAGDRYSFRISELLLFLARGFDARLAALENS